MGTRLGWVGQGTNSITNQHKPILALIRGSYSKGHFHPLSVFIHSLKGIPWEEGLSPSGFEDFWLFMRPLR